jgi:hypothetical protein
MMPKNKYPPELKLKAFGMIADGMELKEIGAELTVPYPKLLEWRKELEEGIENKQLHNLIDIDATLVHEVAEKIAEDLIALDPSQAEAIEGELLGTVEKVDGYNRLSDKLQQVALTLAGKINAAALDNPGADQIESLVTSLAKLQEAFFNKNQTNIAVFPGGSGSSTSVDKFKSLQKS